MGSNVSYEEAKKVAEASRESKWDLPSFGRGLFLGDLQLDLIHPQPKLSEESVRKGEAFLEQLRTVLAEHCDPLEIEREAKIPDRLVDALKEIGALGMKIPEEYDGLGLSLVYYNKALGLAGNYHSSLTALLSAHQSIGVPVPLMQFGTDEQKREWLPKVARTHISAFLLTEPDVGSDPARMSTTAVPTDDGSGYTLNGTKLWATNGAWADVVVVMAAVPENENGKGGITAFIVPYDAEGIAVEKRNSFMGLRGIENSLTTFTDVFVPKENVIGGEGLGLKIALSTLNTGRLALPGICSAASKYALKIAREWSAERKQWGKPIGKHDPVAQKLAFIAGTAFGLEAMVDVCSRMADDSRVDIRIEAAIAKLYASELAWDVMDELVQVRGGRGYETAESLKARGEKPVPVEQMLRDMRINRIFEGSTEIMHLLIAREAVDQHLSVAGDILEPKTPAADKARAAVKAGAFYASWFPKLAVGKGQNPGSYDEFGPLATHLRYAERASRKLARSTFYLMGRYQARMEQKGALLGRIVDIGSEIFAISAACTYAHTQATENPSRRDEIHELCALFCRQARRRAEVKFDELWNNDDDKQYAFSQQLLEGRYEFFEADLVDPAGSGPMIPDHEKPAAEKLSGGADEAAKDDKVRAGATG